MDEERLQDEAFLPACSKVCGTVLPAPAIVLHALPPRAMHRSCYLSRAFGVCFRILGLSLSCAFFPTCVCSRPCLTGSLHWDMWRDRPAWRQWQLQIRKDALGSHSQKKALTTVHTVSLCGVILLLCTACRLECVRASGRQPVVCL